MSDKIKSFIVLMSFTAFITMNEDGETLKKPRRSKFKAGQVVEEKHSKMFTDKQLKQWAKRGYIRDKADSDEEKHGVSLDDIANEPTATDDAPETKPSAKPKK